MSRALPFDWATDLRDGALLVLLVLAYYAAPWWLAGVLTLGLVAAAWRRLDLALLLPVLAAPTYRAPKAFDLALAGRSVPFEVSLPEYCVLVCAVAWALRWVRPPAGIGRPSLTRAVVLPPLALLAAVTLTLPFTRHLHEALREYRVVVTEPVAYALMAASVWRSLGDVWRALFAMSGLGIGMALFSLYHYYVIGVVENTGGVRRILAIYHSPNHLALFLGRLITLCFAHALFAVAVLRRRALAVLPAVALALMLVVLYFTYSRGALIGIAAGLLVLLAGWRPRVALAAGAGGLLLAFVVLPLLAGDRYLQAVPLFQRVYVWRSALAMGLDHPVLGVGLDNFLYYYPQYILPEARLEPDLSHPHDLVLDFWLRSGILGLAAFAGIQVYFWGRIRSLATRSDAWIKWAALALAASMVDFLVHGLIDNSYFLIDLAYMFWFTVALTTVLSRAQAAIAPAEVRE